MKENNNNPDQNNDEQTIEDQGLDQDLQKSLDDNLNEMNDLLKSKKSYSKDDMKEMMKNPKNRKLAHEFMKGYGKEEGDDDDDDDDKMKGKKKNNIKKSFDDILNEHDEVVDAVPVLKSFCDILEGFGERLAGIEKSNSELQKSIEDNYDLQKSFGGVIGAQSVLIKSISEDLDLIGGSPNPVKGKLTQSDLIKSRLDDSPKSSSKLQGASREVLRDALLKSFKAGEMDSKSISKWEQSGYDASVFSKSELSTIESKLS